MMELAATPAKKVSICGTASVLACAPLLSSLKAEVANNARKSASRAAPDWSVRAA